ncbi:MAG: hypothetical protein JSV86_18470 [Gemmatimonadota bacterium]|nr:MAG: hypothetical protein JSV86_18470 [Gemmatimonadota bacterium]
MNGTRVRDIPRRVISRRRKADLLNGFLISTVIGAVLFAWMRASAPREKLP